MVMFLADRVKGGRPRYDIRHSAPERPGADCRRAVNRDESDNQARSRTRKDLELFEAFIEHRDPQLRTQLIERFLPLARQLARRYEHTDEPLEDLMQVASIGLVKAIDRFD